VRRRGNKSVEVATNRTSDLLYYHKVFHMLHHSRKKCFNDNVSSIEEKCFIA
jgi:hypothetical protein